VIRESGIWYPGAPAGYRNPPATLFRLKNSLFFEKKFPVNFRREFCDKSLRHSDFLLRNRLSEPQNRKVPCKIPCLQGIRVETGSNPTASPATHSGAWYDRLFADVVFSEVADRILYAFAPNEAFAADIEERFALHLSIVAGQITGCRLTSCRCCRRSCGTSSRLRRVARKPVPGWNS
jgi:hypothetical protein